MEFELTIIRNGVRTVIANCEQIQARTADHGAVHRTCRSKAVDDMTFHEMKVARMFMRAVASHFDDGAAIVREQATSVGKPTSGATLRACSPDVEGDAIKRWLEALAELRAWLGRQPTGSSLLDSEGACDDLVEELANMRDSVARAAASNSVTRISSGDVTGA